MEDDRGVTRGEAVVLGLTALVAALGYASLQLADLHQHRLWLVLVVTALLLAAGAAVLRLGGPRPRLLRDRGGLLLLGTLALIAAALTLPGFADGAADQDPGVYVAEGVQIARSHSYSFIDPALARHLPVQLVSPSVRFSGIWVRDAHSGLIIPQFFHLQPALLATGYDLGHYLGLELVTPLCGLLGVLLLTVLLRRLAGPVAAAGGGLLLAVNELQVWQSRSPSSEALAQLCWLGALAALAVTVQTRWPPAAGLAGLLVGVGFLDRADGIVGIGLLALLGGVLLATRRWDARAWWGAAGLVVTLPLGLWQAYAGAVVYTRLNKVPSLRVLVVGVVAVLALGGALRLVDVVGLGRRIPARVMLAVRWGVPAGVLLLLVLGALRPHLQAAQFHGTGKGTVARTFNELNVRRFGWLVGYPVLGVAVLGVATVTLRRRSAAAWIFLGGTLAESAIYLYNARNSPQLLFWARRYVPAVLPGFIALAALAVAAVWAARRWRLPLRAAAVALVGGTVIWSLVGAAGVRAESEYAGSFAAVSRIAAVTGAGAAPAVVLWELDGSSTRSADRMLAAPLWLERGRLSVGLPRRTSPARITYVEAYLQAFGPGNVYVVTPGVAVPGELGAFRLTRLLHETGPIRARDEAIDRVPTRVAVVPLDVTVWRVDAPPG